MNLALLEPLAALERLSVFDRSQCGCWAWAGRRSGAGAATAWRAAARFFFDFRCEFGRYRNVRANPDVATADAYATAA